MISLLLLLLLLGKHSHLSASRTTGTRSLELKYVDNVSISASSARVVCVLVNEP